MSGPHRLQSRPWSNGKMRKLGNCIRDDTPYSEGTPVYGEVVDWYQELGTEVEALLNDLDWSPLGVRDLQVTSRAKTLSTLREKLNRDRSTPLQNVGDFAGVRCDAEMSLTSQMAFAESVKQLFESEDEATRGRLKDLRQEPHAGYRAVHLVMDFPAGRCEIQFRTSLQSAWANLYETLGDLVGRSIRYEEETSDLPASKWVSDVREYSTGLIADFEVALDAQHDLNTDPAEWSREFRTLHSNIRGMLARLEQQLREGRS